VLLEWGAMPAENDSFSQRFLCLSRACLGKSIGFSTKWLQKQAFPAR
jgi:hypothetical protein